MGRDIELAATRTPLVILKQAALLGAKTKNVVEAKVTTRVISARMYHSLSLVVPALDSYTYGLFTIYHDAEPYPVTSNETGGSFNNEVEFTSWLQEQLSSPKTKRIVSTLFSQVAA